MNTSKIALYYDYGNDNDVTVFGFHGVEGVLHRDSQNVTPAQTISEMFEYTDENGGLYIPSWPYDGVYEVRFYKCIMNWDKADRDALIEEHTVLTSALALLAERFGSIQTAEDVRSLPDDLQIVWDTYIRDFETGDIDPDKMMKVSDSIDTINCIKSIAVRIAAGEAPDEEELEFYNKYKDESVSYNDLALYTKYKDLVYADSERRVGNNIAAYDVVIRAKRLCRLVDLKATKVIINNESYLLAQAMAVHKHGKSIEVVTNVEQFSFCIAVITMVRTMIPPE